MSESARLLFRESFSISEEGLTRLLNRTEQAIENENWTLPFKNHWRLITEEIATNIIKYAYSASHIANDFLVEFSLCDEKVCMQFTDYGAPFNPLEEEDPDQSTDLEERNIGGLGIFLVKQISDQLTYDRVNNKNILTVEKLLSSQKSQ